MPVQPLCVLDLLDQGVISFAERFESFLQAEDLQIPYEIIDGIRRKDELPTLLKQPWAGLLISGSVHSVYEQSDWIQAVESLIREAHANNFPVFGICFGHQLIASALGGQVSKAPQWEFGTHPVYLTGSHPYLTGVESGVWTSQTHQDHVSELPPGAEHLGLSYQTAHQILACGSCFGVQFHPEYTPETLRYLGQQRVQRFIDAQLFHSPEHLYIYLDTLMPVDGARQILRNFLLSLDYEEAVLA
ncbi:MAG: type 1 glutamine amidotransferase [Candidatus Sericytochromatia bacterium]|nr:type 1 glutamine amidotransferase [Candidatus Sericytochromatia bacterium]